MLCHDGLEVFGLYLDVRDTAGDLEEWWATEPCPRLTLDKTDRRARLRAIGNGMVPQCVVTAWKALSEIP